MENNNSKKGKLIITKEQYNRIFGNDSINESQEPKVKGGVNRVDSSFKKAFASKPISNIPVTKENDTKFSNFKIQSPNPSLPKSTQGKFGKSMSEGVYTLKQETEDLIAYLYRKTDNFSSFWGDNDLTYDDICDGLLSKNLIIKKDGKFEVPKSLGDREKAKQLIQNELTNMISGDITPKDEIEEGDWFDSLPNHPANQPDSKFSQGTHIKDPKLKVIGYNGEFAFVETETGELYAFYYDNIDRNDFEEYVDKEIIGSEPDDEGGYYNEYSDDWDVDDEVLTDYINDNISSLKVGEGVDAWESGDFQLVKVNDELRQDLLGMYDKDRMVVRTLGSLNENETEDERMVRLKAVIAQRRADSQKYEDEFFKRRDAQNRLNSKKAEKEMRLQSNPEPEANPEPKKPVGQYNMFGGVDETTSTGSVGGSFIAPMGSEVIKRNTNNTPVVKETMTSTPQTIGAYDANALLGINGDGSFKSIKKPKAFDKTQYAGGGFVDIDDCTKLNNNKTAQKGGCSTGAIDKVVKVKQSKGNISAPSLNEGIMREALKLQHDKAQNRLIVISDLEGREGSQETFKNKAVLKQSGFVWTGTNWAIPSDKLDIAKKTLSLVNKAEYLIDTLEDLESAVEDSGADNKSLLKSRLDQYISDLANATDEKALSAEIRRYLTFFSKFHSYSFYNRMLIFIQRPEATKVASYKLWQSKYRQVKKGAKAITVLAPAGKPEMTQYDDTETTELSGKIGATRPQITSFRAVNVFDISDTEPIDERGDVPDSPQWWGDNTPSETADMLFGAVSEVAKDMGINVTQNDAQGGEKGFSAGDHINISSDVSGAARLSTMIHEIAHELMHWKKSSIYFIDNGDGKQKAELQELQAESVSYVVLKHYGIPVSHHATYLVLWKANKERIQNNLEIISKVSQFLITKIDDQVSGTNK